MNYDTFYKNYVNSWKDGKDQGLRVGQFFMNELYKHNPELYRKVPADLDCYYNDQLFGACSNWVQERWVNS